MLLHIGGGESVPLDKLICVLGARNLPADTRQLIERARQEHRYEACAGRAKSYLLLRGRDGRETVRESAIAPSTLQKRWTEACLHEQLRRITVLSEREGAHRRAATERNEHGTESDI